MSFKETEAYQHALCMDLTPDTFRFSILNPGTKKILEKRDFSIEKFDRESVGELLKDDLFKLDFGNYILSSGSPRNTLIPVDLFSNSKPEAIFKLNYSDPIDNLDYNRIPELGIVNIYELPLWIKSLFVIKFPRVKVVHRSTVLLKGIFDQPTFSPKAHVFIEENQFYLVITNRSKLVYFNRFDYKEPADLIYYLLFVFEQKEFDLEQFDYRFYGINETWEHLEQIQTYLPKKVKIDARIEESSHFLLAKQLLCV